MTVCVKLNEVFAQSETKFVAVVAHRWNQILANLLDTFEKLKKIGLPVDDSYLISNLPQIGKKMEDK
jgi:hypothetical protein